MRLDKLNISSFKNLKDFSIDFEESKPITVIVGWNGAGKSNLMEALVLIFRDLDLNLKSSFEYELEYKIKEKHVIASAKKDQKPSLSVNGKSTSKAKHKDYLPKQVFGYYSGPSDRLSNHFKKHQERFRDQLIKSSDAIPERPLFYAQNIHSLFVLLAFFFKPDEVTEKFLKEELRIEGLDSILFAIQEPYWRKVKSGSRKSRFWNARGVVGDFLQKLYKLSLAPLKLDRRIDVGIKKTTSKEFIYLFIKSLKDFQNLANQYKSSSDFFYALESIHFSDLLGDLHIRVKVRNLDGSLTFKELSEGEQQLLMVLGLLRFTRGEESLFLLDEPDTHLNPSWSIRYLEHLKIIVGEQDSSHIILASHDPLVIAPLLKEQVRILERNPEGIDITAISPRENPKGMGYAGILTSEMFGLRSTLDKPTLQLLDKKRRISIKNKLGKKDKEELKQINMEIDELGFTKTAFDPIFDEYIKARYELFKEEPIEPLTETKEQKESRNKMAQSIIKKILEKEK